MKVLLYFSKSSLHIFNTPYMYSLRVFYKASVHENEIYDLRDIFRFFCFIFHEFPSPSIALHSIPLNLNIQQPWLVAGLPIE